jgi:hypothetical protein
MTVAPLHDPVAGDDGIKPGTPAQAFRRVPGDSQ